MNVAHRTALALLCLAGLAAPSHAAAECRAAAAAGEKVSVAWRGPEGQPVSAIRVVLTYPAAKLVLPGDVAAPISRLHASAEGALAVMNDGEGRAEVLISRAGELPSGRLFDLTFDRCAAAAPAAAAEIACVVSECASSFGAVSGCTCEVQQP